MGFAIHVSMGKDLKGAPRLERTVYGGADDLAAAKVLADEALAKKAKGPDTQAYVTDMTEGSDSFEQVVYTAGK